MKPYAWDPEKNGKLVYERGVSFEDIVVASQGKDLLATIEHPNKRKYPNQNLMIVNINDYAYIVPYIEEEGRYFLKTIIPSRKMTKRYLIDRRKNEVL